MALSAEAAAQLDRAFSGPPSSSGEAAGMDFLRGLASGGANVVSSIGQGLEFLSPELGIPVRELGQRGEQYWQAGMTPGGREIASGDLLFEQPFETALMAALQSTPGMLVSAVPGFGIARGLGAGVKSAGALGAGLSEGAYSALSNAAGTTAEGLETLARTRPELTGAQRYEIASDAAAQTALTTGPWTAATSVLTGGGALGPLLSRLTKAGAMDTLQQGLAKTILKGIGAEAGQEFIQSGGETALSNYAAQTAYDPSRSVMDGVLQAALVGGAAGGLMGGGMGTVHGVLDMAARGVEETKLRNESALAQLRQQQEQEAADAKDAEKVVAKATIEPELSVQDHLNELLGIGRKPRDRKEVYANFNRKITPQVVLDANGVAYTTESAGDVYMADVRRKMAELMAQRQPPVPAPPVVPNLVTIPDPLVERINAVMGIGRPPATTAGNVSAALEGPTGVIGHEPGTQVEQNLTGFQRAEGWSPPVVETPAPVRPAIKDVAMRGKWGTTDTKIELPDRSNYVLLEGSDTPVLASRSGYTPQELKAWWKAPPSTQKQPPETASAEVAQAAPVQVIEPAVPVVQPAAPTEGETNGQEESTTQEVQAANADEGQDADEGQNALLKETLPRETSAAAQGFVSSEAVTAGKGNPKYAKIKKAALAQAPDTAKRALADGTVLLHTMDDATGEGQHAVTAYRNGKPVGEMGFVVGDPKFSPDVFVNKSVQRQGLATAMYDYAKSIGWVPSDGKNTVRTPDGMAFRNAYDQSTTQETPNAQIPRVPEVRQAEGQDALLTEAPPEFPPAAKINPAIFKRGFSQSTATSDGAFTLTGTNGPIDYAPGKKKAVSDTFRVEARTFDGELAGWVNFAKVAGGLEAVDVVVKPKYRRKKVASEMYAFAESLGNSIVPSEKQTAMGKLFSASREKSTTPQPTETSSEQVTSVPEVRQAEGQMPLPAPETVAPTPQPIKAQKSKAKAAKPVGINDAKRQAREARKQGTKAADAWENMKEEGAPKLAELSKLHQDIWNDAVANGVASMAEAERLTALHKAEKHDISPQERFSDKYKENEGPLVEKLLAIAKKLSPQTNVVLFDEMFRTTSDGTQAEVAGSFDAVKNLIKVSLRFDSPEEALRHEGVHALRALKLFSPEEWATLEKHAAEWRKKYDIDNRYQNTRKPLTEEELNEEAIAEAFAYYRQGRTVGSSAVQRIFSALKNMFRQMGKALRRSGFQSVEDVFDKVESGEVGRREAKTAEGGTGEKYSVQGKTRFKAVDIASAAFKKWFGGSKVVDANGKPLRVYHGTTSKITVFDAEKLQDISGFFFTNDLDRAYMYGEPLTVYLSMKNPKYGWAEDFGDASEVANAEREGYDGVILRHEGSDVLDYIAFRPEQIKSAIGNNGAFDPNNPDIRYDIPAARVATWNTNAESFIAKAPAALQGPLQAIVDNVSTYSKTFLYSSVLHYDLGAIGQAAGLDSAPAHVKLIDEKGATNKQLIEKLDAWLTRFDKLPFKVQPKVEAFLKDNTLSKKWAYQPAWEKTVPVDPVFAQRLADLDKEAPGAAQIIKDIYQFEHDTLKQKIELSTQRIRDEYEARAAETTDAEELKELAESRDRMVAVQELHLNELRGPYSPLKRLEEWLAVGKSNDFLAAEKAGDSKLVEKMKADPKHYMLQSFDTPAKAKAAERAYRTFFGGGQKNADAMQKKVWIEDNEVPFAAMQKLQKMLASDEDITDKQRKALKALASDMYISTLSETSARHAERHRIGVPGADDSMVRSIDVQGRADAHFISALMLNKQVQDSLTTMENEVRDSTVGDRMTRSQIFNEFLLRHAASLTYVPTPFQDKLGRFTAAWMLTLSPGFLTQQTTQPFMMSLPVLAGRFGYGKSFSNLKDTYFELSPILNGIQPVSPENFKNKVGNENGMLVEMARRGRINAGLISDVGSWSQIAKTEAGRRFNSVMRRINNGMNVVESVNRVTSAVASYRLDYEAQLPKLGKEAAHAHATEYADFILQKTQGNYDPSNKNRWMMPGASKIPGVKLVTMFRQFQIIQISLVAQQMNRAFRHADPEERAIARKALGWIFAHQMVMTGAMGVPFYALIAPLLGMALGDDDEPQDDEYIFRRLIDNEFLSNLLLEGAPSAFFGVSATNRLGMGQMTSLLPFTDVDLTKKSGLGELAVALSGPFFGGLVPRAVDGANLIRQGDYYKGLEQFSPAAFAGSMRAYRYKTEGVTMRNGDMVLSPDEITLATTVLQSLGFPSNQITDRQFAQSVLVEFENAFKSEAGSITHRYNVAHREGDTDAMEVLKQEWRDLQDAKVRNGFTKQPLNVLLKAPREQAKRERSVVGGVETTKQNRGMAMELEGF